MLTVKQVSTTLGVSRGCVYMLVRAGLLPATRIGRVIRIPERVLQNFIEAGGRGWAHGWRKEPPPPQAA